VSTLVRVICRPGSAPGFALLGLVPLPVVEGTPVEAAVEPALGRDDTGVLLIEETVYDALPTDLRARVDRSARPVVVPFPGPVWLEAAPAEERVVELLRRAIGYRVKLT
jgi:V/A-type H+/Na+-transporting ATPase subunit F